MSLCFRIEASAHSSPVRCFQPMGPGYLQNSRETRKHEPNRFSFHLLGFCNLCCIQHSPKKMKDLSMHGHLSYGRKASAEQKETSTRLLLFCSPTLAIYLRSDIRKLEPPHSLRGREHVEHVFILVCGNQNPRQRTTSSQSGA